jgi:hypothetical protein
MKKVLIVLSILLAVTYSAHAAVDKVTVGGSLELRGVYLDDIDWAPNSAPSDESGNWYESIAKIFVAVDFTDNVSTMIRLLNDRRWDNPAAGTNEILNTDLAYIKIADIFGYPITATLGRQEIIIGEGFLVGDGTIGTITVPGGNNIGTGIYQNLDPRKAFDALRFTYAEDPYNIDFIIAKAGENNAGAGSVYQEDDNSLYGANVNYKLGDICIINFGVWNHMNREAGSAATDVVAVSLGAEGSIPGVEGLSAKVEIVPQFGDSSNNVDQDALGYCLGVEYAVDNEYKPWVALSYIFRSGDEAGSTTDYEGFDIMFQDTIIGEIEDPNLDYLYVANGCKVIKLTGGFKPIEKVNVDIAYYNITLDEIGIGNGLTDDDWANDYSVNIAYDYNEDVQFGLLWVYSDPENAAFSEAATEIVVSAKIKF